MKESYQPSRIPRELLLQARQTNLAEYLLSRGEPLIKSGIGRYKHAAHNSLVFTDNAYYWNARNEHGNAIDFLQSFYGLDFRAAVMELTSGAEKIIPPTAPSKPPREAIQNAPEFDWSKVELADNAERVTAYLTEARGISPELVAGLLASGRLYQEAKTNNAVFPIYDADAIVGAEVVGTMPQQRFKGIKTGSKYGHGYNLTYGVEGGETPAYALFFESAIDLLSFVDLAHLRGKDLAGCRLTSMMGLKSSIVERTLAELDGVRPFLCVDNDEAGQNFAAKMEGLRAYLPSEGFKDWNEQLLAQRQG